MIITTTFSPMMLTGDTTAIFNELKTVQDINNTINFLKATGESIESAVGHETTAAVLSTLLGISVPFARVNLKLEVDTRLLCITPNFRATEAREFTKEEVEGAGFRAFLITVIPDNS